jgi:hypothetical protein
LYFYVINYAGTPCIAEPEKCSDLQWFDVDNLPEDTIVLRREALSYFFKGQPYSEFFVDLRVMQG